MRDLVPSVQSKEREKHPWRSDTFRKVKSKLKNTELKHALSEFWEKLSKERNVYRDPRHLGKKEFLPVTTGNLRSGSQNG